MQVCYVQAPYIPQPIKYHEGKVKRIKHVRRSEVPKAYRKNRFAAIRSAIHEAWWVLRHI